MREEPSLETLWLKNIKTMDKVQITDRSDTAPSSKTFRDEMFIVACYFENTVERRLSVVIGGSKGPDN
jgi:hypothetical protein